MKIEHRNQIMYTIIFKIKKETKKIQKHEIFKFYSSSKNVTLLKCKKQRFKKYDFCYKHCQEEDIIPKNIKRKNHDDYIKTLNK